MLETHRKQNIHALAISNIGQVWGTIEFDFLTCGAERIFNHNRGVACMCKY